MIRCLVVDDSPSFRKLLRQLLTPEAGFEVVGEAGDGDEALALCNALVPDVMTLDVHMPGRGGYEVIREVMGSPRPVPILVITAAANEASDQVAIQALSLGALEVLAKPHAADEAGRAEEAENLRTAVRVVAGIRPITRFASPADVKPPAVEGAPPRCVGIAASTGGPPALAKILGGLSADFPAPILVVQHIAKGFTAGLVQWLDEATSLRVKVAEQGELLSAGTVYFPPDDLHLLTSTGRVRLSDGARVRGLRPSATVLFTALARDFGAAACGVVLSGMGDDGAPGLKVLHERGGRVLAQDEASSVVWGMPGAAVALGAVHLTLSVDHIAPTLTRLTRPEGARRKPRLLLVDDSETMLVVEKALLKDRFEIFLARNGEEAVAATLTLPLDAVLMDYSMPVMDGETALKAIVANPRTTSLPVVMLTGETDPEFARRCRAAGALTVLTKPVSGDALYQALARALRL